MTSPATARLEYLEKASQLLVVSSPAISAYLGHQKLSTTEVCASRRSKRTAESPRCLTCGSILVPSWSSEVKYPSTDTKSGKRSRKARLALVKGTKILRQTCQRCYASQTIEKKTPRRLRPAAHQSQNPALSALRSEPSVAVSAVAPPATSSVTSTGPATGAAKKRSRGKPSSLKDMLANANKSASSSQQGFGLSLMDFMK